MAKNCIGHGDSGGDVGVHRTHRADGGEIYGMKSKLRISREVEQLPDDFRARLTIHARDEAGKKIGGSECNAHNAPRNETDAFVEAEISLVRWTMTRLAYAWPSGRMRYRSDPPPESQPGRPRVRDRGSRMDQLHEEILSGRELLSSPAVVA